MRTDPGPGPSAGITRRKFIGTMGVTAAGLMIPLPRPSLPHRATAPFTGTDPLRLAMHVHGSWSEGVGSWEGQLVQAAANDIDVLFMTDHDSRATAVPKYVNTLADAKLLPSATGTLARRASTVSGGSIRLLAESSKSSPATAGLTVEPSPTAFNKLRTSIAGQSLRHSVSTCNLSNGATYEIIVALSYHPPSAGRPAGKYELCYRFGAGPQGRSLENGGLRGVVRTAPQAPGSTKTLNLGADVKALWPDMLAIDNCFFGLSFVATSPRAGAVADVAVSGVQFVRTQNDPAHVIANQKRLITAYAPRFPGVAIRATTEVSRHLPDMNPFGVPQFFSDYALDKPSNHDAFYRGLVADVHADGGVISWNHPFGYGTGPLLSASDQIAKRRNVFGQLRTVDLYGVDILEVGYTSRGSVDTATHLDLWDTFSRDGRFLTGNGTSDDHQAGNWRSLANGFITGAWGTSVADAALVNTLSSGRVFVAHCGRWPGGEIDMIADDVTPMGSVTVSAAKDHALAVYVKNLPSGGRVELVSGPVDYGGAVDPGTQVLGSLTASDFPAGIAHVSVSTTSSRFVRTTVRRSDGVIVGAGNPIWLLREQPPRGIPPSR